MALISHFPSRFSSLPSDSTADLLTEAQAAGVTTCQNCRHIKSITYGHDMDGIDVVDFCTGYGPNKFLGVNVDPASGKKTRSYRVLVGPDRHDIVTEPFPRTHGLNDGQCPKYLKAFWLRRLWRHIIA